MNSSEFLNEVLNSELCPDNFEEIYKDFCHFQKLVVDALKVFCDICNKNGITYQMAFGSLIGAIRDGGQIPWDYDVDVFVPAEERETLIDVLRKELPENYAFYCPESDSKYCRFFMRIAPKGYDSDYLHLDIFYLIGLPDDTDQQQKIAEYMRNLACTRYCKYIRARKLLMTSSHKLRTLIKWGLYKIYALFHFYINEYSEFLKLSKKYPAKTSAASCPTYATWKNDFFIYPGGMLKNTKLISTELGQLCVPEDAASMLTKMYGNYEEVPPLEARIQEVMSHYDTLKRFARLK